MQLYHLVVYVPVTHADSVRKALADAGAGRIGEYESCSFSCRGTGRYCPCERAHPHIGRSGELAEVEEERVEVVVTDEALKDVLRAVKEVHPYEEPALHLWPMLDYKDFLGAE